MSRRWTAWASFALLASTEACFASKNDIRLLQTEIRVSRDSAARADAARAAQSDSLRRLMLENQQQVAQQFAQTLAQMDRGQRALNDSISALAGRFLSFQATASETWKDIGNGILQLAQLNQAQSSALANLRRAFEQDSLRAFAAATGGAAGSDSGRAQGSASDIPGPATLYGLATAAFNQHSCGTARGMFDTFVQQYPKDQLAAEAQKDVASTFECEGNTQAADSVYQLVVAKYPLTDQAATALFKHGDALCKAGHRDSALAAYKKIVSAYPGLVTVMPEAKAKVRQSDPCA